MRRRKYSARLYDGQSTRWVCGPQNEPVCQKAPSINGVIVGDWVNASDQNDTGCQRAPKKPCAGAGSGRRGRRIFNNRFDAFPFKQRFGGPSNTTQGTSLGRSFSGNWYLGGRRRNNFDGGIVASPMFDYVIKTADQGQVNYYGVIVDGDQEIRTPITREMFINITGEPDTYLPGNDGVFRYRKQRKWGKELRRYNRAISAQKGYPEAALNDVLSYQNVRETALAFLFDAGVPVGDENDLFEIFGKFSYYAPELQPTMPDQDYSLWSEYHTQGRNENNFDWGGLIQGITGGLMGLGQMVNQQEDAANLDQLQGYVNNYVGYMQDNFAVIERDRTEKGPQAALNALLSYKNGSWKELTDFIRNFANQAGLPFPADITKLIGTQTAMENQLRQEIASGAGITPGGGDYTPGGHGPTVGPPDKPPGSGSTLPSFDFTTILLIFGAIVGVGFIMKKAA